MTESDSTRKSIRLDDRLLGYRLGTWLIGVMLLVVTLLSCGIAMDWMGIRHDRTQDQRIERLEAIYGNATQSTSAND